MSIHPQTHTSAINRADPLSTSGILGGMNAPTQDSITEREECYHSEPMGGEEMIFSQHNSRFEFSTLNKCIETSHKIGEISGDDAETLIFFLELVQEALTSRGLANA